MTSLPAGRLRGASLTVDEMRRKIVATKEGGMITGEERMRENLADLYGSVLFFDGRPTLTQQARGGALGRELLDIGRSFDAWMTRELPGLNTALAARRLPPIGVPVP